MYLCYVCQSQWRTEGLQRPGANAWIGGHGPPCPPPSARHWSEYKVDYTWVCVGGGGVGSSLWPWKV